MFSSVPPFGDVGLRREDRFLSECLNWGESLLVK
jgi:hypothetical protein